MSWDSPTFIPAGDPEWCAGCAQKHSKCECSDPSGQYAAGGFVSSQSLAAPIFLDPDECVVNRDRFCIRPDHPTATSDGNRPGAWWVCEGPPT